MSRNTPGFRRILMFPVLKNPFLKKILRDPTGSCRIGRDVPLWIERNSLRSIAAVKNPNFMTYNIQVQDRNCRISDLQDRSWHDWKICMLLLFFLVVPKTMIRRKSANLGEILPKRRRRRKRRRKRRRSLEMCPIYSVSLEEGASYFRLVQHSFAYSSWKSFS